jgi:Protein of unknown function (DUF2877)
VSLQLVPAAASSLLADLLDAGTDLVEVARTRCSVHYETGRADVPVLCVCEPTAVRLPSSVVTPVVPQGRLVVRAGALVGADATWRVTRWWRPPRPRDLTAPTWSPAVPGVDVPAEVVPGDLVGAGPGLTPSGDDLLAGALVAAHAVADPRLPGWQRDTRTALRERGTTAVSRGLLSHALDGWATPELAAFVTAACAGDVSTAAPALLAVGHSSGPALAAGALHVLDRASALRGAA